MRILTDKEIKQKELEILLYFDEFCKKQTLRYSLCGGTLLGAIRHKGFIPWDDDIDVMMPRPDYERLILLWSDTNIYQLRSIRLNNLLLPFSKIANKRIQVESKMDDGTINTNLWIDIFPVDGLPENNNEIQNIYRDTFIFRRLLYISSARLGEGQTPLKKYSKYILKPLVNAYGRKRLVQNIEKLALRYSYETSKIVGSIAWGQSIGEQMDKKSFEQLIAVDFEGHILRAMSCWHKYLSGMYGDYMIIPPEGSKKSHRMVVYTCAN